MRFLLDTHTFIWFVTDSPKLSLSAKALIEDEYNEKLFSTASIWEMAIKHSLGKLRFDLPLQTFVKQQITQNSMDLLSIELDHLAVVATMPLHHRDPFDRLLIAQAIVEQVPILGMDSAFDAYSIQRLW
ncbi:type II toxin-antitoxin system VapC family toxin [Nostoc sp. CHAB 5714]|uniref:Type II toxin-antitoxin system VapC family toxin n=2 Tax=Nostoc TaxID=1177 RepID=A0ABS8IDD6_9NOSO|nr:type II toxin-antitoxin system VapC family toxin [Nostoc favosum]MCC5602103.1 type II toxin-antitoxin system VapC family toxin [Nostoc favosum CHAB5714]